MTTNARCIGFVLAGFAVALPAHAQPPPATNPTAAPPAPSSEVGLVVVDVAALAPQLIVAASSWLSARGYAIAPGVLDAEAIRSLGDCLVLDDPTCARTVVDARAKSRPVVVIYVKPDPNGGIEIEARWYAADRVPRAERRGCGGGCPEDALRTVVTELLTAVAPPAVPPASPAPAPPMQPPITSSVATSTNKSSSIGVIAGAKLGGIVPLDGLSPFVQGGIELGYVLPALDRRLAIVVAVDYTQPRATDAESDPRVVGGMYTWQLTEREIGVMATLMFRATTVKPVIPYGGIGPRILFARSTVRDDGAPAISATREQSTRIGVGIPAGVELPLGPGSAIGELLLQYGRLDHTATGDASTGAITLALGYRMVL